MRYTESRMTKLSGEMLKDLVKDTVDLQPNFDETLTEPSVLPATVPTLLINGSEGIAVGMATKIPPHNMNEIIGGLVALIDDKKITTAKLMEYIKGPDFPTGGTIMGREGIYNAYTTGRGQIVVRAKAEIEPMARGGNRMQIIVSELPYQVNKSALMEKAAGLVKSKMIDGITEMRDESDREMRVVIELKRGEIAQVILNQLYKHSQMQTNYSAILLCLVDGVPKVLTLYEILNYYILHRREVIRRRTQFDLARSERRAHILDGYRTGPVSYTHLTLPTNREV